MPQPKNDPKHVPLFTRKHFSRVAKRRPPVSVQACRDLLEKADAFQQSLKSHYGLSVLEEARELCSKAGISTESGLKTLIGKGNHSSFTGGHSNTNHYIPWTGDEATDRVALFSHRLAHRYRTQCPESASDEKWDKPRVAGERRRRVARDKDQAEAPPLPPKSGYVTFVGHMTTKWRHDHPDEKHEQTKVVQEISKQWRLFLTKDEVDFYNKFAEDTQKEYEYQLMEFRTSGTYTRSKKFKRVEGAGLWLHIRKEDMNGLEEEISTYQTVLFPPRPAQYDKEYESKTKASIEKRKQKIKEQEQEKQRMKEELYAKYGGSPPRSRKRKRRRKKSDTDEEETVEMANNSDEADKIDAFEDSEKIAEISEEAETIVSPEDAVLINTIVAEIVGETAEV